MRLAVTTLSAIAAILTVGGWPAPARAACYERFGCTDADLYSWRELRDAASCQVLWEMRNGIFHDNLYCFRTARAIGAFGNDGCRYRAMSELPLNRFEYRNILAIRRAESAKGCL